MGRNTKSAANKGFSSLAAGNVQDIKPAVVVKAVAEEIQPLPNSTAKSLRIQVGQTFCPIMGCNGQLIQWGVRKNEDGSISRKFQCPDCGQVSYSLVRPTVAGVDVAELEKQMVAVDATVTL